MAALAGIACKGRDLQFTVQCLDSGQFSAVQLQLLINFYSTFGWARQRPSNHDISKGLQITW
jgi:hypothetical protein